MSQNPTLKMVKMASKWQVLCYAYFTRIKKKNAIYIKAVCVWGEGGGTMMEPTLYECFGVNNKKHGV